MSIEEDQSQFLDNALKSVKSHSSHMKNAIDKNDMRQCLKYASEMISELKTNLLSPKNYYQLYTSIFDEIQYLQSYIRDEAKRGRRLKELYEAVQQSISIIPRIFLMIIVGTVFIESNQCEPEELIYDIIKMIRGIQYPLRGLFSRYFLLKMFKDFFPHEQKDIGSTTDLIIANFKEMNKLWIRIGNNDNKQREELKVLVGENITRLSSLNELTSEIYKKEIIPKLIRVIDESNDAMSQQYVIECIIHAFPDEYNIESMSEIFDSVVKMSKTVDVKSIFITIMEKISKYVDFIKSNNDKKKESEINEKVASIFETINKAISSIIQDVVQNFDFNNTNMDVMKLTELQIAFMKFTISCAPISQKLDSINAIMESSHTLLSKTKGERKMSQSGIRLVMKLLTTALESPVSIFQIKAFPELMTFLDNSSKATLSLNIIDNLVNDYNIGAIDSKEKMNAVIELVKPLIEGEETNNENGGHNQFEYEQSTLSKLSYISCSKDPEEQFEILVMLKDLFIATKNENKLKYSLVPIINSLLLLGYQLSTACEYKENESKEEKDKKQIKKKEFNTHYLLDKFDPNNKDAYLKFYQNLYAVINDVLTKLVLINPEISFKLYLSCACQVDKLYFKASSPLYEEFCYSFIANAMSLLTEGKIGTDQKYENLCMLIGCLISISILSEENRNNITTNILQISQNLMKRTEQANAMMLCSKMFTDKTKISDCLTKAKKYADYAMTSPNNAILFVSLLNEYVRYDLTIEKFDEIVKPETVIDLVEYVKNFISTVKEEKKINEGFNKVESYFNNTMTMIKQCQDKKIGNIIGQIKIE